MAGGGGFKACRGREARGESGLRRVGGFDRRVVLSHGGRVIEPQAQQWFFSIGGERFGPVGFDHLLEMARAGDLDPRKDLVWTSGQSDWEPAGEVEGLFERRLPREPGAASVGEGSPPAAKRSVSKAPLRAGSSGTGRFGYAMGTLVLPAGLVLGWHWALPWLRAQAPVECAAYLRWLVWPLVIWLVGATQWMRLRNLGMSPWWVLGWFLPFLNFWLGFRLMAAPAGYAGTRKLDRVGKLLAFCYWAALVMAGAVLAASMFGALREWEKFGLIDDLLRQIAGLWESALEGR